MYSPHNIWKHVIWKLHLFWSAIFGFTFILVSNILSHVYYSRLLNIFERNRLVKTKKILKTLITAIEQGPMDLDEPDEFEHIFDVPDGDDWEEEEEDSFSESDWDYAGYGFESLHLP